MFEQMTGVDAVPQPENKTRVFIDEVNRLVEEYASQMSEEQKTTIFLAVESYGEKMPSVADPAEAARRLVMSHVTSGSITE